MHRRHNNHSPQVHNVEIQKIFFVILKKVCVGCEYGHPSQKYHTCLWFAKSEIDRIYEAAKRVFYEKKSVENMDCYFDIINEQIVVNV